MNQAVAHVYLRMPCPVCPSTCNCALRRTFHRDTMQDTFVYVLLVKRCILLIYIYIFF